MSDEYNQIEDWNGTDPVYIGGLVPETIVPPDGKFVKLTLAQLGGSVQKLIYGYVTLAVSNITIETLSDMLTGVVRNYTYILRDPGKPSSGLSPTYAKAKWDIYENEILVGNGLTFASFADVYAWLQNPVNGISFATGTYTYNVRAVIYDEMTSDVQPISRMNGMNQAYSSLRGRKLYKSKYANNILSAENTSGVPSPWSQDFCEQVLNYYSIPYTWNNDLKQIFYFGKTSRSVYGQLHSATTSLTDRDQKACYDTSTQTLFPIGGIYEWNVDSVVLYFSRDFSAGGNNVAQVQGVGTINKSILDRLLSTVVVYRLYSGDNVQFLVKPLGIDHVYIDWVDAAKYDLLKIKTGRNLSPRIYEIDLSTLSGYAGKNVLRVGKDSFLEPNAYLRNYGKNSIKANIEYRFALRDKTTNKISFLSNQAIKFLPPKRNAIIDMRVE
jgi:hypothetical protein